jgi:hypothetical protein
VTVCVGVAGPQLVLMDPKTLDTIASTALPPRLPGSTSIFNDFAGCGYFYLDNRDRAVVPTTTRHVFVVAVGAAGFTQERDYDLTGAVAVGDKIISALPDWSGRLWFASTRGVVGTVAPSGQVRAKQLGEGISNSFAVDDQGGVYVVTQKALYRLDAAADGSPAVSWRERYRNSGIAKPGQSDAGSGTTPTVVEGGRVSIADNDDPMNVDVNKSGHGCHRRWHSNEIAPSLVPKLSTETGLVYTYTKPRRSDDTDAWYFTALDFCNGRTVYRRLAGTGLGYNNNFAPVTLGPDGAAYVGALGGLIRVADSSAPSGPPASSPRGCNPKPRLKLSLRYRHGRGKAHGHVVTARVRLKNGQKAALRRRFKVCARS